jgi:glycosyltransferase involved in cell wall biosynthesis
VLSWTHRPEVLARLRERAAAAGNITLHPPTQDMRPIYAGAKILLAPSQWEEAWGRVATEAHVNGVPVLGSNRGGLPEAIGPGGVVLPADAPAEDWAAALSRLWDDPVAYAASSKAARAYSRRPEIQPATIAAKLRGILLGAIAGKAPSPARRAA